MGQDMTLHFETFETVVFFLSVLVVNCKHPLPISKVEFVTYDTPRLDPRWQIKLP